MKLDDIELNNFIDIFLFHMEGNPYVYTYLKDAVSSGYFLNHGASDAGHGRKYYVRNNVSGRKPTNSSLYAHEYFDAYLKSTFGISFRSNSLFTTANGNTSYGQNFAVIPLDEPTYCFSPYIFDLYMVWQKNLVEAADRVSQKITGSDDLSDTDKTTLVKEHERILEFIYPLFETGDKVNPKNFDTLSQQLAKKIGVDATIAKVWLDMFIKSLHFITNRILKTYEVSNTLSGVHSKVIKENYEIMVHSPKFLFINKKELVKKHSSSPLEFFEKIITRYDNGERY